MAHTPAGTTWDRRARGISYPDKVQKARTLQSLIGRMEPGVPHACIAEERRAKISLRQGKEPQPQMNEGQMSSLDTVTVESLESEQDPGQVDHDSNIMGLRTPIYRTSIVHLTLSGINSLFTLLLLCATLFTIIFNAVFPSLWYLSFLYTVLRILHICAGATAYTVKDVSSDHLKTRVSMACAVCGISVLFSLGEAIGRGFETNYYMKTNDVLNGVGSGVQVLLNLGLCILSAILTVMCAALTGKIRS